MADENIPQSLKSEVPRPTDWQLRNEIRNEVETETRAKFRVEYETLFNFWKDSELTKAKEEAVAEAKKGLEKLWEDWKKEQKPPTDEDIQQLLNQEYATFNLQIQYEDEAGEMKEEVFVLRELPQAAEKKFYRQFKDRVLKKTSALGALAQAEAGDQPFEEKAKAFLEMFDESFDMLSDAVVICLNPFSKRKEITREWVQNNIGSNRQWNIIDAQIKVNRLKDFFSKLSQSGQSTQMMLGGVNFPRLQQLAR